MQRSKWVVARSASASNDSVEISRKRVDSSILVSWKWVVLFFGSKLETNVSNFEMNAVVASCKRDSVLLHLAIAS